MIVRRSIFDTIINLYKPYIMDNCIKFVSKIHFFYIWRQGKNKERAKSQRLSSFLKLPWKDSNPHRRNQNPTCYHYTTRQLLSVCVCKVIRFVAILQMFWQLFFKYFCAYFLILIRPDCFADTNVTVLPCGNYRRP